MLEQAFTAISIALLFTSVFALRILGIGRNPLFDWLLPLLRHR